jgi:peptide/nickel transport system substrate-binding protein
VSKTSRRAFLGTIGSLAVGVLAACQSPPPPAATPKPAASKPTATSKPAAVSKPAQQAPASTPSSVAEQLTAEGTNAAPLADVKLTTAPRMAPKRGGELRIVQTDTFVSLDPIHATGPAASSVYESLFAWRPNAEGVFGAEPLLAKSWELSPDKLVVRLREGVTFHDGSALNADAVAWNVARMIQNPKSLARNLLPQVDPAKPVQALDPLTVQINLTRPSAAVLNAFSDRVSNTTIVSKAAAEKNGEEWLKLNPVGTGPFKLTSFTPGDKLVVERNPGYWKLGEDGQPLPYADRATYRVISPTSTQLAEMQAGAVDWISNMRGRDVAAAKQISHATFVESALAGVRRQAFINAQKPPFKDNLKLRQAINYAIDRAAMAKSLGGGLGIPLPYGLAPGSVGYDTAAPFYEYNPDRAKQLLAESGVTLPLTLRLTTHNREADQEQARLLQSMLDKVGIKLNLDVVDRAAWIEKVRVDNDFEMATRQSGVVADPAQDLLNTWAEDGSPAYHRARVPGLLDTLQKADTEYDEKKRHQLFVEAQKLMHESAWFVYLWFENGNFLVHKRIQGFPGGPGGPLREAEWWINE